MKRLLILTSVLAACGDNHGSGPIDAADIDARIDAPPADASADAEIDAPIDAPPPTPAELLAAARGTAAGTGLTLPIEDVTITYLKPAVDGATANNDPAGFTVQIDPTGPAMMIEADVATLTPAPAVGDVVSFTIGEIKISGLQVRGAAITGYTRSATGTDIAPLVQDVSGATDFVSMIGNYEAEVVDATVTIAETWGNSGNAFQRARVTSAGIPALDTNFQLRLPTVFRDTLITSDDLGVGCVVEVNRTPVNRFTAQAQLSAFVATDLTIVSCLAPTVMMAAATDATTVRLTFTRLLDTASVLTDGTQFTISDGTNSLAVTAASASDRIVTLTTAAQTPGTVYTVTVLNTVEDVRDTPVGTPNTGMFMGFTPTAPVAGLLINEVDYDQAGSDTATFVEIFNPTANPIPLANLALTQINGANSNEYGTRAMLSAAGTEIPAGGYLVVRQTNAVTVPAGTLTIDVGSDFLQNDNEGVALIDTVTNTLVDGFSYEMPAIMAANIAGFAATVQLFENTAFTTADTTTGSLGRFPNGGDTNNSSVDWSLRTMPTPGAAN